MSITTLPVIAIVGRPNVGKSTLFNCLTRSRDALVADFPGLTRDRQYGQGKVGSRPYIIVDTGGLGDETTAVETLMAQQSQQAIIEADHVLFVVDGRAGLTAADQYIAESLRKFNKAITLVVNKAEGLNADTASSEFYRFGLGAPQVIAAAHGQGVPALIEAVLDKLPIETSDVVDAEPAGVKIAIVGKPNVGKSTLVNRLLGEERVVVFDQPGTTRDSIAIPYERHGKPYVLIDTAGVRRRRSVEEGIEKFSVIKTLQAIESANVVVMIINAREGITEQDLHLLGFVIDAGKALVIAVNKWDGLSQEDREAVRRGLDRRLVFCEFAKIKFISALHGTGVGELYQHIDKAYESATQTLSTPELTRLLEAAVATHQPPLVSGRRVKLRYAHPGGYNPPTIIIHGKQTTKLPDSYRRYLESFYRKALKMVGTPIHIEFKDAFNPYVNKE